MKCQKFDTAESYKKYLLKHNQLYREGKPKIADEEYDTILEAFKDKYPKEYPLFRESLMDPTSCEFKHKYIVGSLDKIKSDEQTELTSWKTTTASNSFVVSPKIDGLSMVLYYKNKKLIYAATRGDGETGELKTEKLRLIVPDKIPVGGSVVIRGEVVLTEQNFNKLKIKDNKDYKNPRNAAVGIINSKTTDLATISLLNFYAYRIFESPVKIKSYQESLQLLNDWGFSVVDYIHLANNFLSNDTLDSWYDEWKETLAYEIDGLVIQANEKFTENVKLPKYARAYKINNLAATTTLKDVEWNISKSGYFIPTGIVEPVSLGGATIQRVTLFNAKYVKDNNLGIGSKIIIQKSGDIIPYVKTILETSDNLNIPKTCKYCNTPLANVSVDLHCSNPECPVQISKQLAYLLKNTGVEVAGETQLLNWGITDIDKLLAFRPDPEYKNQIKFYNELLNKFFTSSPKKLISCMDFDGVSIKTFKKLFKQYFTGDVEDFICVFNGSIKHHNILTKKLNDIVDKVQGVGLITLHQIYKIFKTKNYELLTKIVTDQRYKVEQQDPKAELPTNVLEGKTFVFTGALTQSRNFYEAMVQKLGGEVRNSVTKNVSYVVTEDTTFNSKKLLSAKKLNIPIINEKAFTDLCK